MATDDDFIDGDIFDPEVAVRAEDKAYEAQAENDDQLKAYIQRRREAYSRVFAAAQEQCPADLNFMMQDLAAFCRAFTPTFHPTNSKVQDALEGRREVFYRVQGFTRLPLDTLYRMYMDAKFGGQ